MQYGLEVGGSSSSFPKANAISHVTAVITSGLSDRDEPITFPGFSRIRPC